MKKCLLVFCGWLLAAAHVVYGQASDLFISEYVEGSSNNKALEFYNGTCAPVDLTAGQYVVQLYFNGSATSTLTVNLTGTVAAGDVFVLAQASANATILAQADQTSSASWFNGDDAIVLRKGGVNGTIVDAIGQVGVDPGTEWGTGLTSTADNTLRRKSALCGGDVTSTDAFDPATQWDGFAADTFDGLGAHSATCPVITHELLISQYIEGSSNNKALELYNSTGTAIDLAAGQYVIQYYFNGSTTAGATINLTGTVANQDAFVLAQASANATILAQADQTSTASWYNGDDAIVLRKGGANGTIIDAIGQIGVDPGTEWGTGLVSTADNTLQRKSNITVGDTDASNAFDPAAQWNGFATDDFSGLGTHALTCGGTLTPVASIALPATALDFGDVTVNQTATKAYIVTGTGLTQPITVTLSGDAAFTLSTDNATFTTSVSLPASGDTVFVRFAPTVVGAVTASITHVSGSIQQTLALSGNGFDPLSSIIPISTARTRATGTKVTVAGRITASDQLGSPSYLQDATGGIPVFSYNLSSAVEIGDSVVVTGPISPFRQQVQISGTAAVPVEYTIVNVSKRVIEPKPITIDQLLANEGLLVTVQNVSFVNKNFVLFPQSTEKVISGSTQGDLRIDGDTDLPGLLKPQTAVDITGVVGRFDANAQLLPRFQADVPGTTLPVAVGDSVSKENTFDVATWNLEFFGAESQNYDGEEYGPANELLQLQNVKRVLDSLNADVIAIQEVSNDSLFAQLVAQLPGYSYTCSNRFSYSFDGPSNTFPPQKVCFLYKTSTVDVVQTKVLFEQLYDAARSGNTALLPNYPTGDPGSFWSSGRLPYLLTADVTINGVKERVTFVNIHAKSGATASDGNRRAYDAKVLKDSLDAYYPNEQIILLGDYNDDTDQSIAGGATPYQPFVTDSSNYKVVTKALSAQGYRSTVGFTDMIDNITISNDLVEEYIEGSETVLTPFRYIHSYADSTSDHLPVTTRFAFQGTQISFTQAADTVAESAGTVTVTLAVSKASSTARTVKVKLTNGSGVVYGTDYTTTPALADSAGALTLTIPAGATMASFAVMVNDDSIDELDELLTFTIDSATSGLTVGSLASFALTITDNDLARVSFATTNLTKAENAGTFQVLLNLVSIPATNQSVTIQVTNGTGTMYGADYTTNPSGATGTFQVAIPAGSATASFAFNIVDDTADELNETVSFAITSVSSSLVLDSNATFTATIVDNDVPVVSFKESAASIVEGSAAYTVILNLATAPVTPQTVTIKINDYEANYGLGGKGDYSTNPSGATGSFTLTIPAGATTASFTITPDKNAAKKKEGQKIDFTIQSVSAGLQVGEPKMFTLTIIDKNSPVFPFPIYCVSPNPTNGPVKVTANPKEYENVLVQITVRHIFGNVIFSGMGTLESLSQQISSKLQNSQCGLYTFTIIRDRQVLIIPVVRY
jgi:predicted extracellular nuclease